MKSLDFDSVFISRQSASVQRRGGLCVIYVFFSFLKENYQIVLERHIIGANT